MHLFLKKFVLTVRTLSIRIIKQNLTPVSVIQGGQVIIVHFPLVLTVNWLIITVFVILAGPVIIVPYLQRKLYQPERVLTEFTEVINVPVNQIAVLDNAVVATDAEERVERAQKVGPVVSTVCASVIQNVMVNNAETTAVEDYVVIVVMKPNRVIALLYLMEEIDVFVLRTENVLPDGLWATMVCVNALPAVQTRLAGTMDVEEVAERVRPVDNVHRHAIRSEHIVGILIKK